MIIYKVNLEEKHSVVHEDADVMSLHHPRLSDGIE